MEKLRATGRLLRYSPKASIFDRRLCHNSGKSIHSSGSGYRNGLGKKCGDEIIRKWNVRTCFGLYGSQGRNLRDCMERGVVEDMRRMQHRGFGSVVEKVQRDASFSTLNSDDISYFKGVLGEKNVVEDEERLAIANTDWMHKYRGSSKLLLQPRTTEEVSQILKYCDSRSLAVVPQGGNTGLVGGSVPVFDEVVINMSMMNKVISFDKVDMQRHLFISDLLCHWTWVQKEAARLVETFQPMQVVCALYAMDHFMEPYLVWKLFWLMVMFLTCLGLYGKIILALDLVLNHLDGVRNPLPPTIHNFYVLIETTGSNETYDREKLEAFLVHAMEGGLISDGAIAQDINQASAFWYIREGIPEALMKAGAVYKYDLSLPVEKMYDLVDEMRTRLGDSANVVGYGHLGDGNLHLNVSTPQYDDKTLAQIEPFVYEWTSVHRGSISAVHGLGLMKANKIFYSKPTATVKVMASIKKMLDPKGILNPYKVLPHSIDSHN